VCTKCALSVHYRCAQGEQISREASKPAGAPKHSTARSSACNTHTYTFDTLEVVETMGMESTRLSSRQTNTQECRGERQHAYTQGAHMKAMGMELTRPSSGQTNTQECRGERQHAYTHRELT